ncbi:MAG: 2-aminoethylphosphonate aminotransferase [Betaproteobacteria bacterium]|nr:2-aminoethylphosphonate aminotransferase [Betaproteobacteria bacterium]
MILLNPGPVTLTARVRQALNTDDMCHREPEFAALTLDVLRALESVYDGGGEYAAVMLSGSGTCAVEAMLSTFASKTRPTLVVCNGVYGERMASMLARQGKPAASVTVPWAEGIDVAKVEAHLDAHPDTAHVAVVHNETTTGRLNDLTALAALCEARRVGLLIDAVSSFGGEALPMGDWKPLAIAGTANKCLHGAPGVSFVLARRDVLETGESHSTSLYLDLSTYYREQLKGWSPFTQAVHVVAALCEALREFQDQGGWAARNRLYVRRSTRVRRVLADAGVETMIPIKACSSMLTAFSLPKDADYTRLHDELKDQGFVIYAGQGPLAGRVFRIATMGDIGEAELDRLADALQAFFSRARA